MARAALALLLLLPLAGLGRAADADVSITSYAFTPKTLVVAPGATVRWSNDASLYHTVTGDAFDAGSLAPGDTYEHAFPDAGSFAYHCLFHTQMQAKVLVADPAALPDLRIRSIAASDALPGLRKSIVVTVANDGPGLAAPSTLRLGYAYHGALHVLGEAGVPLLGPLGDTASFTFTWDTLGKVGDFVLDAEADSGHAVPELDETNDHGQATASVLLAGVPGVDALDPVG